MPASAARVRANQQNSAKSTGPKTAEGKERSRANAYKHGLTATVVLPQREAAEVERRVVAFHEELQPAGEVGQALVRHAATMSVRMERCVAHETAMLTERVIRAEADFVPPEGVDEATAAKLRTEAGTRAMFDPSPEATLARRYEAAATRGFFRALKELRQLEKAAESADAAIEEEIYRETLASFSRGQARDIGLDALGLDDASPTPRERPATAPPADLPASRGGVDVPITVGRRR